MHTHRIVRTFHSTCTVHDYEATVTVLGRIAGLRTLEFSDDPSIGRRGGMTWIGDNALEVSQPTVEGHPAQRFLSRFGPGMHSYAFQVSDLQETVDHLASGGVRVGAAFDAGYCFTDPRTTGGLLFEWSNYTVAQDPRKGASLPAHWTLPLLDIKSLAFVGGVVPDPLQWAESYAELFGLTETFRSPSAKGPDPIVGLAAPDCTLALFRLPGVQSTQLWGTALQRPRFHLLGLSVRNIDDAHQTLSEAAVPVLWRTSSSLMLSPDATGEVPIILVERHLPGDPRD